MKQLKLDLDFQNDDALHAQMLAKLHRDKQGLHNQNRIFWESFAADRHLLTITPAERFLPNSPDEPTSFRDVAFLQEVGLWDIWKDEGRTERVLDLVNEALSQAARDILIDDTSSDGHTDFGSEAAWWWQHTGHNSPPPTPRKRPPPY